MAKSGKLIIQNPLENVRECPEMYVGTSAHPTHLVIEVIDNSVDEIFSNTANGIIVKIDNNTHMCTVIDNGRGLPNKNDEAIDACTIMNCSGKFKKNRKENLYKISIGKHGVGLKAVNFLSTSMEVSSICDGSFKSYSFKRGIFKKKKGKKINKPNMTRIVFSPDPEIFESLNFNVDYIKMRLQLIKIYKPNIQIKYEVNGIVQDIPSKTMLEFFKERMSINKKFDENSLIHYTYKNKDNEEFELFFYINKDKIGVNIDSVVNLLPIKRGEHIKFTKNIIYEIFKDEFKNIKKTQLNSFYDMLIILLLDGVAFGGQNKQDLQVTEKKLGKKFDINIIKKELKKVFQDQKIKVGKSEKSLFDYFKSLILKYMTKKELDNVDSETKTKKGKMKLKDCECSSGGTLFIVEGDSASGNLVDIRDYKKHAIYPIRGKILNVEKSTLAKILNNAEVMGLINVIGMHELDKDTGEFIQVKNKCKYSSIVILCDPDADGYHISLLLMKVFNTLMKNVIDSGMLYVALTPLYGGIKKIKKKRKFIPIHCKDDYDKVKKNGYSIVRHKGLGEFNADDLEVVLFDNPKWIKITHMDKWDKAVFENMLSLE